MFSYRRCVFDPSLGYVLKDKAIVGDFIRRSRKFDTKLVESSLAFAALPSEESFLIPLKLLKDRYIGRRNNEDICKGLYTFDNLYQIRERRITGAPVLRAHEQHLLDMYPENLFICGGHNLTAEGGIGLNDHQARSDADIDYFIAIPKSFSEKERIAKASSIVQDCLKYLHTYFRQDDEDPDCHCVINKGAQQVSFRIVGDPYGVYDIPKIQFILRIYPDACSIVHGFDLSVCKVLRTAEGKLYATPDAVVAILQQCLIIDISNLSLSHSFRVKKYYHKCSLRLVVPGLKSGKCHFEQYGAVGESMFCLGYGSSKLFMRQYVKRITADERNMETSSYDCAKDMKDILWYCILMDDYSNLLVSTQCNKKQAAEVVKMTHIAYPKLLGWTKYNFDSILQDVKMFVSEKLPKSCYDKLTELELEEEFNPDSKCFTNMVTKLYLAEANRYQGYGDTEPSDLFLKLQDMKEYKWIIKNPGRQGKITARSKPIKVDVDKWYTPRDAMKKYAHHVRRYCILGVTNLEYWTIKNLVKEYCKNEWADCQKIVLRMICESLRTLHLRSKVERLAILL